MTYKDAVQFHGHTCPGLAWGWRMTLEALKILDITERSGDEELVAVVENDACVVDAVQFLAGCTFGKGNLIFRDWGKMAFTLIRRDIEKAVRVIIKNEIKEMVDMSRDQQIQYILEAPVEKLLNFEIPVIELPPRASGVPSVVCSSCGESTMQTRTIPTENGLICRQCALKLGFDWQDTSMNLSPERLMKILNLTTLPGEDGFFNEVYRSDGRIPIEVLPERYSGDRAYSTAIYYMLIPGVVSRLHRVKSDEIFHLYSGGPAKMTQIFPDGTTEEIIIGNDIEAGQRPMVIVPEGVWQETELLPGAPYALFGCTVAPGFEFDDFELK